MAFSGGFFCQPRQTHARVEHVEDIGMVEVKVREHHHGMKPEIGHLVHQRCRVAVLCGILGSQNHLGGFFTDFFEDFVQALSVQRGDVRAFGRRGFALRQHFIERCQ